MEVEIAVKLRRDLEGVDREIRHAAVRAAAKARVARTLLRSDTGDAFGLFAVSL